MGESGLLQEEVGENFEGSEDAAKEEELDDYEDEEAYEEAEEEYYEEDYHEAEEAELKGEEEGIEEDLGATETKENLPAEVESAPIQGGEGKVETENSKKGSSATTDKKDHEPESQPVPVDVKEEAEKQNTDENEGKEKEKLDVKSEEKECTMQSEQGLVSKTESPGKNNEQDVKENTEQEGECPRMADGDAGCEAAGKDTAGNEEKESSIVEDNAKTEECPVELGEEVCADDNITVDEKETSVEKESESKSTKDEDAQIEDQPKEAASELPEPEPGKERPSKLEVSEGKDEAADPQAEVKVSESEKKTEGLVKLAPSPTKTNEGEKKPESRLTPASSPTKTEELVPNIEWK